VAEVGPGVTAIELLKVLICYLFVFHSLVFFLWEGGYDLSLLSGCESVKVTCTLQR